MRETVNWAIEVSMRSVLMTAMRSNFTQHEFCVALVPGDP